MDEVKPRFAEPKIIDISDDEGHVSAAPKLATPPAAFECQKCLENCGNLESLEEHLVLVHLGWLRFKCSLCDVFSPTEEKMVQHLRQKHNENGLVKSTYHHDTRKAKQLRQLICDARRIPARVKAESRSGTLSDSTHCHCTAIEESDDKELKKSLCNTTTRDSDTSLQQPQKQAFAQPVGANIVEHRLETAAKPTIVDRLGAPSPATMEHQPLLCDSSRSISTSQRETTRGASSSDTEAGSIMTGSLSSQRQGEQSRPQTPTDDQIPLYQPSDSSTEEIRPTGTPNTNSAGEETQQTQDSVDQGKTETLTCQDCNSTVTPAEAIDHAEKFHMNRCAFRCHHCRYRTHFESHMREHIPVAHSEASVDEFSVAERGCTGNRSTRKSLLQHCFGDTEAATILAPGRRKHKWRKRTNEEIRKRKICQLCGHHSYGSNTRHVLLQHMTEVMNKCRVCGKGFQKKDRLVLHLKAAHDKDGDDIKANMVDRKHEFREVVEALIDKCFPFWTTHLSLRKRHWID